MHSKHRPIVGMLIGLAVGLLVVTSLVLLTRTFTVTDAIRKSQVDNTAARKSSDATLEAIQDCTQPSGECFKRGQKQTASAVGDINKVVILAAACSVGLDQALTVPERQQAITTCVLNRLALSHP